MNLIGAPYQIIIGKQSDADLIEFKEEKETQKIKLLKLKKLQEEKTKIDSTLEKEVTLRFLKARKKDGFLNVISVFL